MPRAPMLILGLAAFPAHADFATGFERPDYQGFVFGAPLNGQQGWWLTLGGTVDSRVYTYAGNTLGLAPNPVGGRQFVGGRSEGTAFARAMHQVDFGPGQWMLAWDMAARYAGTLPAAPNLSSFSLNHSTLIAGSFKQFIALNNFIDPSNPAGGWRATFNVFSAVGAATNNQSPGPFWTDLHTNHWYRQYVTVDLMVGRIERIALLDLHTGASALARPEGWYLAGGASANLPMPDAIRFFVGGTAGDIMGWDNIAISQVPAPAGALLLGAGVLGGRRRRAGSRRPATL